MRPETALSRFVEPNTGVQVSPTDRPAPIAYRAPQTLPRTRTPTVDAPAWRTSAVGAPGPLDVELHLVPAARSGATRAANRHRFGYTGGSAEESALLAPKSAGTATAREPIKVALSGGGGPQECRQPAVRPCVCSRQRLLDERLAGFTRVTDSDNHDSARSSLTSLPVSVRRTGWLSGESSRRTLGGDFAPLRLTLPRGFARVWLNQPVRDGRRLGHRRTEGYGVSCAPEAFL
jgi:hypothetical protein